MLCRPRRPPVAQLPLFPSHPNYLSNSQWPMALRFWKGWVGRGTKERMSLFLHEVQLCVKLEVSLVLHLQLTLQKPKPYFPKVHAPCPIIKIEEGCKRFKGTGVQEITTPTQSQVSLNQLMWAWPSEPIGGVRGEAKWTRPQGANKLRGHKGTRVQGSKGSKIPRDPRQRQAGRTATYMINDWFI